MGQASLLVRFWNHRELVLGGETSYFHVDIDVGSRSVHYCSVYVYK